MLGDVGVGLWELEVPQQRLGPVQQEGVDGHGVQPVDRHLHDAAAAVVLQLGREGSPAEQRGVELRGDRCGRPRRDVLDELLEGFAGDRAAVSFEEPVGEGEDRVAVHSCAPLLVLVDQRSEVEALDVVAAGADGLDLRLSFGALDAAVDVALGADVESGCVCNSADGAHDAADQVEQLGPFFLLHRTLEPRLTLLLVVDLQQPEGDAVAFALELLLDLVVVQTALVQKLVDIFAGP